MEPICSIHGTELVCLSCRAAHAGHAKSPRKSKASSENFAKARKVASANRRDPNVYGKDDVVAYLKKHVGEEVTAADLIKAAPRKKKATARVYAHQHLFHLRNTGVVSSVAWGTYRVDSKILQ